MDSQTQHEKYRMEYSDELERKRQVDMLNSTDYSSTLLHGVENAGQRVGEGVKSYLDSPQQLANTAYTITGIAIGIYSTKMGVQLTGRFVERQMGKPSLVRDISRITFGNLSQSFLKKMKNPFRYQNQHLEDAL